MNARRNVWIAAPLTAALVVGAVAACFSERDGTGPVTTGECPEVGVAEVTGAVVVAIRDYAFMSDTVRVAPETRVVWVNCADANEQAHTTTSDDGVWDSPLMVRGGTFSRTFENAGEYPYHCEPHPFMRGVVIVE